MDLGFRIQGLGFRALQLLIPLALLKLLAFACIISIDENAWGRRGSAQRYASLEQKQQNLHRPGRAAFR